MTFIQLLQEELSLPLPGIESQIKMAPENRKIDIDDGLLQNAAVSVVIITLNSKEKKIILIKRPEYDGHHSGQVSFPGGKEEPEDRNMLTTAMRETYEEIGLQLSEDDYLGELTPLLIPVSRFMVHPFIFIKHAPTDYTIDPNEVDYIIPVQLTQLIDANLIKSTCLQINRQIITTPYFAIGKEIVWGATAMILSEFVDILYRIERKNPGLF